MVNIAILSALSILLLDFLGMAKAKFQIITHAKRCRHSQLPPYIGRENYDLPAKAIMVNRFNNAFESSGNGHRLNMTFQEWFACMKQDWLLCRTHRDCDWLDARLYCQNYKVELENPWFGMEIGQEVDGYCACPIDYIWDDGEIMCREPTFLEYNFFWVALITIVLLICIFCGCKIFVRDILQLVKRLHIKALPVDQKKIPQ